MEKEFIPYSEALELKQLGFNETCFGHFLYKKFYLKEYHKQSEGITLRPLYQQAFRWFRKPENGSHNHLDFMYEYLKDDSKTYEEAELASLRRLIEIIKIK